MAAHLGLTLSLARQFDAPLLARFAEIESQAGVVTFVQPGRATFSLHPTAADSYQRVERLDTPTTAEVQSLCAAEDERCLDRKVNIDPEAYGRGAWTAVTHILAGRSGKIPGVSDLSAQVAGLMLDLKPRGPAGRRGLSSWKRVWQLSASTTSSPASNRRGSTCRSAHSVRYAAAKSSGWLLRPASSTTATIASLPRRSWRS